MRPLFILRAYNDIDHISPLIYQYIIKGQKPVVLFISSQNFIEDERIKFIKKTGDVEIIIKPDFLHEKYVNFLGSENKKNFLNKISTKIYYQLLKRDSFFGKLIRNVFFDFSNEYKFLKEKKIGTLIVEWGNPFVKGFNFEKIIVCAKAIGIPIFSLPHGLNIFLNSDLHQVSINALKQRGQITTFKNWNFYDYVVVQTKFHKEHLSRFGLNRDRIKVWGSLRYCYEWQKINLKLYKPFLSKNNSDNKCKIVFMLPHWIYNVYKKETLDLIFKIAQKKNVYLVIKDHTREDTGMFPVEKRNFFLEAKNVEFDNSNSSTSLISWSDITINVGSSIGIEALLQNKLLINPIYLTFNRLAQEANSKTLSPKNDKDVLESIDNYINNNYTNDKKERDNLINRLVYNSSEEYDVMKYYYDNIMNLIRPYN